MVSRCAPQLHCVHPLHMVFLQFFFRALAVPSLQLPRHWGSDEGGAAGGGGLWPAVGGPGAHAST